MGFQFGRDRLYVTSLLTKCPRKLACLQIDVETTLGLVLVSLEQDFPPQFSCLSRIEDNGSNLTLSHNSFPRLVRLDTSEPSWDKNQPFTA